MHSDDTPTPTKRNKRKIPRQATSEVAWEFEPAVIADSDPLLAFAPYLHKQPRRNSITPDLQRAFVRELAATGIVKAAAARIGRSLEALYKLRQRPGAEGFASAWDEAIGWGCCGWRIARSNAHWPKAIPTRAPIRCSPS